MRHALVAGFLIASCGKSATVDNPTTNGSGSSMNKTSERGSNPVFEKGTSLSPKDKLVEWLDKAKLDGKPRLLRAPIVIGRGQVGFDISKAKLGELEISIDDTALGVGLGDRADQKCGDAQTCAFLVQGYWRGGNQLAVNKAEPLAADAFAAATFVEVEGESGN
jgi:hypothetical protein